MKGKGNLYLMKQNKFDLEKHKIYMMNKDRQKSCRLAENVFHRTKIKEKKYHKGIYLFIFPALSTLQYR